MQIMQKGVQMRYCSNILCTVFLQATNAYSVWHTQRCVDSPEPAQREALFMWMIFSFSGWCFWILGISYVSWLADTLLSLLPHEKGQASVTSANKTSTGPCCSRHKPLPSLWPKAWPVLISFLTLQSFMTLPHVIIAPRWSHASLERKWEGEADKGVMEGERQKRRERNECGKREVSFECEDFKISSEILDAIPPIHFLPLSEFRVMGEVSLSQLLRTS